MKKIAFVLLAFVSILSCSKKEDEIIPETVLENFEITSEQTSVKPLELVIITSSEVNFIQNSYKGTINETEIDLIKTENNELIFSIPSETSIGSAKLELIIGDKKGELSLSISENNVQNIETVVNTEVIEPFNEFENDLDALISNSSNSQIVKEQLESAKQMISAFLNKYNTLSNDERMEVAKFFNANPIFTSDFLNLSGKSSLNGNPDYDCFKLNSKKVVYTTVSILTFINYLPHLTRVGPLGSVAALSAFIAGIYGAVAIISAAQEQLLNDCFLPFENFLKDGSGNTDDFELNNESNYTFQIFSKDRKLVSSDLNSSNSILSTTVSKFNTAKQKWNTLKNGINNIISSTTNWFSGWFGSVSSSFKTITYEFKDIPSTSDEIETNGDSKFITIEDFPSDVEVEYSVASDNSINLKFKADESTLPRTVSGKIKYNDGDFSNENEFSVNLIKTLDLSLERISSYHQIGIGGQNLGSPLVVKVVDSNGNPIEGKEIHWNVIEGNGSLENTITYTSSNGEASNNWQIANETLYTGTSACGRISQKVNAILKDGNDNEIGNESFIADKGFVNIRFQKNFSCNNWESGTVIFKIGETTQTMNLNPNDCDSYTTSFDFAIPNLDQPFEGEISFSTSASSAYFAFEFYMEGGNISLSGENLSNSTCSHMLFTNWFNWKDKTLKLTFSDN